MEIAGNSIGMIMCQKAKDAINKHRKEFLDFVIRSLSSGSVATASEALLPFDYFISVKQHYND